MMAAAAPATVHGQAAAPRAKTVRLWLWLPLTPLFWLLSPLALLIAPFLWAWLPQDQRPRRPYVTAFALGRLLVSLSGLAIDVRGPGTRLSIRIF